MRYTLQTREFREVNTDPQRRCYYGHHFSYELRPTEWESLRYNVKQEDKESVLKFWKELNDYAVSQRGESARREFRYVEES